MNTYRVSRRAVAAHGLVGTLLVWLSAVVPTAWIPLAQAEDAKPAGPKITYDDHVKPFRVLAKTLNSEFERLFPKEMEILAEPGRFLVATAGTLVASVIGKAVRDGKQCYYINDGVYHTFSGIIFDHIQYHLKAFKAGPTQICSVFGPTCDALDTISLAEQLPDLELGDLVYSENIGAYSHASSTYFNGFPPAKVVHVNQ